MSDAPRAELSHLASELPRSLYHEGLALARERAFDRAIPTLCAALQLDPTMSDARLVLGKSYAQTGRLEEAVRCWEAIPGTDPQREAAEAALRRARALLAQPSGRRRRVPWGLIVAAPAILVLGWAISLVPRLTAPDRGEAAAARAGELLRQSSELGGTGLEVQVEGPSLVVRGNLRDQPARELALSLVSRALAETRPDLGSPPAIVDRLVVQQDAPLAHAVEIVLTNRPDLQIRDLSVTQSAGTVAIRGSTLYAEDRATAARIAAELLGEDRVNVAGLEVEALDAYEIRPGDNLWSLARRFYGRAGLWPRISDANPDLKEGEGRLRPGRRIRIPPGPKPPAPVR